MGEIADDCEDMAMDEYFINQGNPEWEEDQALQEMQRERKAQERAEMRRLQSMRRLQADPWFGVAHTEDQLF